ncbi:MAG: hypothetical protein CSYNP_00746 [Syntrophus sp. SKADARSKE-3]|nr:hypothetical protein [Syntrophus sp. SKADARSKE-3]
MKILGIRFKNLNSLEGEWQVDFTHPDYASDGIFAITGPTGAGKTTILDALCLALYGRTPRLERVTKTGNEIMSLQTGECFAEVTFETQKGRYRCHWSQRRARKLPGGELQQARHEIADADSGAVLESKIVQVGAFIENVTGMDFDRFTRSMLLAQGGFAAFLQAPPDERAPILEQITGTEIYSRISMNVHERLRKERASLDLLQAEFNGFQVLNEQDVKALEGDLSHKSVLEGTFSRRAADLRKTVLWLETVTALETSIAELHRQWETLETHWMSFAPDKASLERARKADGLEGDYRAVLVMRRDQAMEIKELAEAVATYPDKEQALAEAIARKSIAENALAEVRLRQQDTGEVIKKVRDIDIRSAERKKQADDKKKTIRPLEYQEMAFKNSLQNLDQDLKETTANLESIREYLTAHEADKLVATQFSAVARGFATLRELLVKYEKAKKDLAAAESLQEATAESHAKIAANHEKYDRQCEEGQRELKGLADEMAAILRGRHIGDWHKENSAMKDRERILAQAGDAVERADKIRTAINGMTLDIEALKNAHGALLGEIKTLSDRKALLDRDVQTQETQVALLGHIRDLEEERKRLEDGKPCPLCGAVDHPYGQPGQIPEMNRAEEALQEARKDVKKTAEALGKLENEAVRTQTRIAFLENEEGEKRVALANDERHCAEWFLQLHLQASPEKRAALVRNTRADVLAKITETDRIIADVEQRIKKEQEARQGLEKMREQRDLAAKSLQESRLKKETAMLDRKRRTEEVDNLEREAKKAGAAALEDVRPFGVLSVSPERLDAVLKDLEERRDAWQQKTQEKDELEKNLQAIKTRITLDQAELSKIEADLETRRGERQALVGEYEALRTARREIFADKNADEEEKSLADAVAQAEAALNHGREIQGALTNELGALKEKIAVLTEKTDHRAEESVPAERRWAECLTKAGFADEQDFVAARLTEESRDRLAERENALLKEKTELDARMKDRSEALAAEKAKNETDKPMEALRHELEEVESSLKHIQEAIGAIKGSLHNNSILREKQREHMNIIEARKKERDHWEALHQLIGSADGKKFRNFAQGLTFEMMILQANQRLRKMTDRYLLIRDEREPLELNVIDNYQAGEIRSAKNLSGGESFIVSLALALGLSQMASRKVRVDSLFLDEGFGTLDDEALETALATLANLRQDSKIIGVISHVTALKERIATQIQVTPGSGGRSILSGPGCRRL